MWWRQQKGLHGCLCHAIAVSTFNESSELVLPLVVRPHNRSDHTTVLWSWLVPRQMFRVVLQPCPCRHVKNTCFCTVAFSLGIFAAVCLCWVWFDDTMKQINISVDFFLCLFDHVEAWQVGGEEQSVRRTLHTHLITGRTHCATSAHTEQQQQRRRRLLRAKVRPLELINFRQRLALGVRSGGALVKAPGTTCKSSVGLGSWWPFTCAGFGGGNSCTACVGQQSRSRVDSDEH